MVGTLNKSFYLTFKAPLGQLRKHRCQYRILFGKWAQAFGCFFFTLPATVIIDPKRRKTYAAMSDHIKHVFGFFSAHLGFGNEQRVIWAVIEVYHFGYFII